MGQIKKHRARVSVKGAKQHVPQEIAENKPKYSRKYKRARGIRSSARWQKVAELHKRENPLCALCDLPVFETHHIQAVSEHPELAFDFDNLVSLCEKHHDQIHAAEQRNFDSAELIKMLRVR